MGAGVLLFSRANCHLEFMQVRNMGRYGCMSSTHRLLRRFCASSCVRPLKVIVAVMTEDIHDVRTTNFGTGNDCHSSHKYESVLLDFLSIGTIEKRLSVSHAALKEGIFGRGNVEFYIETKRTMANRKETIVMRNEDQDSISFAYEDADFCESRRA